jgi:hypothetical protein
LGLGLVELHRLPPLRGGLLRATQRAQPLAFLSQLCREDGAQGLARRLGQVGWE